MVARGLKRLEQLSGLMLVRIKGIINFHFIREARLSHVSLSNKDGQNRDSPAGRRNIPVSTNSPRNACCRVGKPAEAFALLEIARSVWSAPACWRFRTRPSLAPTRPIINPAG